jgi:hypothetical protein
VSGDTVDDWLTPGVRRVVSWIGVVVLVLAPALAFVIGYFNWGVERAAVSVGIAIVTVTIAGLVGAGVALEVFHQRQKLYGLDIGHLDKLANSLASTTSQLDRVVDGARRQIESRSLLTADEILEYEGLCYCTDIWISSRDLEVDVPLELREHLSALAPDLAGGTTSPQMEDQGEGRSGVLPSFHEVIAKNLAKGINYTYILRRLPSVEEKAQELRRLVSSSDHPGVLRFVFLSDDDFKQLPYTQGNFAIYNPLRDPSSHEVFISAEFPRGDKKLWITVSGSHAMLWVDVVSPIVERDQARAEAEIEVKG